MLLHAVLLEQSRKLLNTIATQIENVKDAMDECNELKRLYQENVDNMSAGITAVDDLIEDAKTAADVTKQVGEAAGTIAALM